MDVKVTTKKEGVVVETTINIKILDLSFEDLVARLGEDFAHYVLREWLKHKALTVWRNLVSNGWEPEKAKKRVEEEWFPNRRLSRMVFKNTEEATNCTFDNLEEFL